jgi:hypothetical protein
MKKLLLSLLVLSVLSVCNIYSQVKLDIHVINHGSANSTEAIFGDVDMSGADDVLLWDETGGTLSWYRNDGAYSYTGTEISNSLTGIADAEIANIDADVTSNDIICITGASGKNVLAFINDKAQNFTETILAANVGTLSDLAVFDYENDGDLDFAVTEVASDSVFIFINDGATAFTKTYAFKTIASPMKLQVIDIDKDNDLDFLVSSDVSDNVAYYANDGAGTFAETVLSNTVTTYHAEALDFDGDNDNDVLILDYENGELLLLTNDGAMNFTNSKLIEGMAKSFDFAMKDFDGDSDADFIFSCDENAGYWYENIGSGYNQIQFVAGRKHQHVEISGSDILMTKETTDFEIYSIEDGLGISFPQTPANNSTDVTIFPTFEWSMVQGATGYIFEVDDADTFDDIFNTTETTSLSLEFDDFLFEELTTYYWRVKAITDTDTSDLSTVFSFTTQNFELDSCNIKLPADSSEFVSRTPVFEWTSDPLAKSFRLEISENEDLSNPFLDSTFAEVSPFVLEDTLKGNTKYFWRIQAIAPGSILNSEVFELITLPATYAAPTLLEPGDTEPLADLTPEFIWNSIYAATTYRLQIDTVSTFGSVIMDTTIADTNFVSEIGRFEENTTYFWRVMAMRDTDSSDWSSIFSLPVTVENMVVPTPIYPENSAMNIPTDVTLRWSVSPKITAYQVRYWSEASDSAIVEATQNTFELTGLIKNEKYIWQVRSLNDTDTTDWSANFEFTTASSIPLTTIDDVKATSLDILDVNNDNLTDIIVPDMNGNSFILQNNGKFSFDKNDLEETANMFKVDVAKVDEGDFDDVLLTSFDNNVVKLLLNPTTVEKQKSFKITENDSTIKAVFFGEGEQGLKDVLFFTWGKKQFFISKYDSTAKEFVAKPASENGISLNDFILADVNFDDNLDVVYHSPADSKIYYMSRTADTLEKTILAEDVSSAWNMRKADYNNNGFEDIVFVTSKSTDIIDEIVVLRNNGTDSYIKEGLPIENGLINCLAIADYNNDGHTDMILGSPGEIMCCFNNGDNSYNGKLLAYGYDAIFIKAADLNNDNYPDLTISDAAKQTISFFENTPLGMPILTSPIDSVEMIEILPELTWEKVEGALSYDLRVMNEAGDIILESEHDTTSVMPEVTLEYGKFYSWTVRAEHNAYLTGWSKPEFFKTETNELSIPTLISPVNNATEVELEPTLVWNSVASAVNYQVKLTTLENEMLVMILDIATTDTNTTIPVGSLNYNQEYKWSVMAMAPHDSSEFSEEWAFTTEVEKLTQTLVLEEGWNAVSLNIIPEQADISVLFKDYPEVEKIADQFGQSYTPNGSDNIPNWDIKQAYDIRVADDVTIDIIGTAPTSDINNYSLIQGINYINYPFTENQPIEEAFEKAGAEFAYVYDGKGRLFMPSLNVDCIGEVKPGKGYKVYSKAIEAFTYLSPDSAASATDIPLQDEAEFIKPNASHPLDFCFIVVEANIPDECEVVAFSEDGVIVGSGAVSNNKAVIAVYADDQTTAKTDGARTSEKLELRYYIPAAYSFVKIYPDNIEDAINGTVVNEITYNDGAVYHYEGYVVSVQEDNAIENVNIYPMPVKNKANIEVVSEETRTANVHLFDLTGKPVANIFNGLLNKGENKISLDASNINSGTYHIVIQTDKGVKSQKIIIEK